MSKPPADFNPPSGVGAICGAKEGEGAIGDIIDGAGTNVGLVARPVGVLIGLGLPFFHAPRNGGVGIMCGPTGPNLALSSIRSGGDKCLLCIARCRMTAALACWSEYAGPSGSSSRVRILGADWLPYSRARAAARSASVMPGSLAFRSI